MRLRDYPLGLLGIILLAIWACVYMVIVGPYNYFTTGEFWL